jgi:hypothetical protein
VLEFKINVIRYHCITQSRIVGEIITHPEPLPQSLVVTRHLHLTYITTKALRVLTLWLQTKSSHAFRKPVKCINVELIIRNYSRKKITNALIRPFQTIAIICQIYKRKEGNYLLPVVAVVMYSRSFHYAQPLYDIGYSLQLWQCDTPKFWDHHASSAIRPPMLTSSPPQPSSATDIAPHDT